MKYPEYATRGERCPWCKNLKQGRCSGCGQVYGHGVATGSIARRGAARRRGSLLSAPMPPVEVSNTTASNAGADAPPPSPQPAPPPVVLVLPEPPTANHVWKHVGNRVYLTHEGRAYKEATELATIQHRVDGAPRFTGDVVVVTVWHRSFRGAGDLDNRCKVLNDSLQGTIYVNDKQISQEWRRRVDAHDEIPKGHVRVEVSQV